MKKYILFAWSEYNPCGGWGDFAGSSDDFESLIEIAYQKYSYEGKERHIYDFFQIIDRDTFEMIKEASTGWRLT